MSGKSNCRSCGKEILWVKTKKGKNMPVDFDSELEDVEEFDRDRMQAHWDTCPQADQHRKRPSQ